MNELEKLEIERNMKLIPNDRRKKNLYKIGGDLILQNEFFERKITRHLCVSFEGNPVFQVKRRTAVMCERMNQNK